MNVVFWGIIVGTIAVMLSLSIMPASASHIVNTCVIQKSDHELMKCRKEITDGQGIQIINRAGSYAGNCLYDTTDNGLDWDFQIEPESVGNCDGSFSWSKSKVQAR